MASLGTVQGWPPYKGATSCSLSEMQPAATAQPLDYRGAVIRVNLFEASTDRTTVLEEESVCKLAKAFFVATTKHSVNDEDLLPQVKIFYIIPGLENQT